MEIDPEVYKPLKIDDAFHCQPSPGFEWWYFDANFDNGYSLVTSWHIAGKAAEPEPDIPEPGRIAFAIYDPEGKRTATAVGFPVSAVSASRETCDVKMGDNPAILPFDHPTEGQVKIAGFPVRYGKTEASIVREAPELGQHTEEVLSTVLGYTWEEIAEMREAGVL